MKIYLFALSCLLILNCKSTPNVKENNSVLTSQKSQISNPDDGQALKELESNIKTTVTYLASDELKGRDTGSEGIAMAADYLEKDLISFGVKPFFEEFKDHFMVGDKDAFNVVGLIEGNDLNHKSEYIVIGAHYDHIGISNSIDGDSISNGANDNASGAATILELARHFGKNKTNGRSLIFAFFSAEEKGLQGSKHLAKRLKEQKINLYTMLNFEMTGVPFTNRDYVAFLTGYDLSNMADVMNKYGSSKFIGKSDVSEKYNLFKRSDNYAFYQEFKKPSQTISTCDLTNFEFYHKVGDEAELMDYEHMARLINSMMPIIEKISNAPTQEIIMNE